MINFLIQKNVLRGIHGDDKTWKLVSCIHGKIFQVIVDLRKDSKTFKKWKSYEISSKNKKSILIPPNFGNAFWFKVNLQFIIIS